MIDSDKSEVLSQAKSKLLSIGLVYSLFFIVSVLLFSYGYNQWRSVANQSFIVTNNAALKSLLVNRVQILSKGQEATDKFSLAGVEKKLAQNFQQLSQLDTSTVPNFDSFIEEQEMLHNLFNQDVLNNAEHMGKRRKMALGQINQVVGALTLIVSENAKQEAELYRRIFSNDEPYVPAMMVNTYVNAVTDQEKLEQLLAVFSKTAIMLESLSLQTPTTAVEQHTRQLQVAITQWQTFYAMHDNDALASPNEKITVLAEVTLTDQKALLDWQKYLHQIQPIFDALSSQQARVKSLLQLPLSSTSELSVFVPQWAMDLIQKTGLNVDAQYVIWALFALLALGLLSFLWLTFRTKI